MPRCRLIACACMMLATTAVLGQQESTTQTLQQSSTGDPTWVDLRVVDQRVEDLGSLSSSLRVLSPGLQQPNDFGNVYQVPGSQDMFMRIEGALHAVFPRSIYAGTTGEATIPPGTVFHIGEPTLLPGINDATMLGMPSTYVTSDSELRWNTRVDASSTGRIDAHQQTRDDQVGRPDDSASSARPDAHRLTGRPETSGAEESAPAICRDLEYRSRRLRELLRHAALEDLRSRDGDAPDIAR